MEKCEKLLAKTEQMKMYLQRLREIYEEARSTGKEFDFFTEIKPFVDEAQSFANEWAKEAILWVEEKRPKNLFPQQIEAAKDNFNQICPQAFFAKTSYSRFKHHFHSIRYILEKLLAELQQ